MKNKQVDEVIIRHQQLINSFEDVYRKHIDFHEKPKDIKSIFYRTK